MKPQSRVLRWSPLVVIAALIVGYTLIARAPNVFVREFWIGWLIFYGAYLAAWMVRTFGPRFTATLSLPLDERELMVRVRAHAISGVAFSTLTMLGCFYMASAGAPGLWHPRGWMDRFNLGFGVQACGLLLPTLIASWLEPRLTANFED